MANVVYTDYWLKAGQRLPMPDSSKMTPEMERFLADSKPHAPRPIPPPHKTREPLRARIVAVTEYAEDRVRVMARAAVAYGSGGCVEAEFMSGWKLAPGQIVHLDHQGVHGDAGPWRDHTWPVRRWAHNTGGLLAPMFDDSGLPPETRAWMRAQGEQLGLKVDLEHATHEDRTRVWIVKLETGRGSTSHIKMPGESWREVCEALGLGWPGEE